MNALQRQAKPHECLFQHTFFMPDSEDVDVIAMIDNERHVDIVEVRHTLSRRRFRPTAGQQSALMTAALVYHDEMWRR